MTPGYLLPIGGAEDKRAHKLILSHFARLAGASTARIVVIPAASAFAAETGALYDDIFGGLGAAHVETLHIDQRRHANEHSIVARIEAATGIFITGGDQLKLMTLLGGTRLAHALRARFHEGMTIAGTSAGASALSRQMIAFGRSGATPSQRMVQLTSGLGLAESMIIDQHFRQRNRLGRLMTAVALNPGLIGVGVDEDTAFSIAPDGDCEVIGSGSVTIVDGRAITFTDVHSVKRYDPITVEGIDVRVYHAGERYRMGDTAPILPLSPEYDPR